MMNVRHGPATYFPSIEAKYGRTINHWKALMLASGLTTHKDLVEWLKRKHDVAYGTMESYKAAIKYMLPYIGNSF